MRVIDVSRAIAKCRSLGIVDARWRDVMVFNAQTGMTTTRYIGDLALKSALGK